MRSPEDVGGERRDGTPMTSNDNGPAQTGPAAGAGSATWPQTGDVGASYRAQKREFLGIGLSCLPDEEFIGAVRQAVETRSRLTISFINPDYVLRGHKTPGLLEKMNRFDIVLPDGWGVVFGGRLLGLPVPDRQGNDDICPKMFALSAERGFSNFLFGCAEGTAQKAAANLRETFPGLPIAGALHGYQDVARGHPGRYDQADVQELPLPGPVPLPDIAALTRPGRAAAGPGARDLVLPVPGLVLWWPHRSPHLPAMSRPDQRRQLCPPKLWHPAARRSPSRQWHRWRGRTSSARWSRCPRRKSGHGRRTWLPPWGRR